MGFPLRVITRSTTMAAFGLACVWTSQLAQGATAQHAIQAALAAAPAALAAVSYTHLTLPTIYSV